MEDLDAKINWRMTTPSLKVLVDWLFASKHLEHQLKMQILGSHFQPDNPEFQESPEFLHVDSYILSRRGLF